MIFIEVVLAAVLIGAYVLAIVAALPFTDEDGPVATAIEAGTWLPPH